MTAAPARADARTWITVGAAIIGAFMAVLNIQITNASLPDIQGAIGAGLDDGGWISTAYLVAEIVVIPLTGFLSSVFSLRRYLLANTVLFLVLSVACAFAQDLSQMIVLRALQGFFGGTLIPLAFTLTLTSLPAAQRPIGLALFALSATFAPAIGPTIGGWLTETYGWQYIFYVNIVPGLFMLAGLWPTLPKAPMQLGLLRQGDWAGIATLSIGLATLQTVLEEGNKDDWFGSPFIVRLSVVAAVSLVLFVWIELTAARPLLDLRLLARRNFGLGTLSSVILGVGLYGSVFLLPLYLSQMQGYNSEQVGEVLAWTGLPQLVLIPLVPRLMRRIDARLLVAVGMALFAGSCFLNTGLSPDYAGPQLLVPNIIRAVGQALVMTPLTSLATAGIEASAAASASAIYNMVRNLGGAIGIAALQTLLTKREQFHSSVLSAHVSLLDPATQDRLAALQQRFLATGTSDPATAWHDAVVAVGRVVRAQSYFLAYADAFFVMGAVLLLAMLAALLMRKSAGGAAAGAH
ncbi:DHA2 family efflux MFS transporter permease subunit [Rhodovastum atsumiense]|uniref:DHA2 family efflux MFS transporter permease subunit n=1 Tax=Rhodovastum atsumiense TaxID=504468 RepID=A0A5M6IMC9_9PROT|nr:DHA2 family efflux MFS transporter permease subunit [Rhodovastum atsumiense]KAA5609411.1 DHA2 family efflux MFS transporter permease subunit [Rhodovastum atsumiense]CAH2601830.1 DHA2 family efflux MFS transporter permease subunit [Rhodovastum atsumiense]